MQDMEHGYLLHIDAIKNQAIAVHTPTDAVIFVARNDRECPRHVGQIPALVAEFTYEGNSTRRIMTGDVITDRFEFG